MNPLRGVVVSGASSGIGAATALLLARSGYVAFAGVRSEADAARLRAEHDNLRPAFLEVTDEASIAKAIREITSSGVDLIGVVSNAGIAEGGALEHIPVPALRKLFDTNVVGALALVQAALPHLPSPGGRVVFVGSIAGRLAMPYNAAYSASKFALRAIADGLRLELAPAGIAVSLIEAPSVDTPIWRKGAESRERVVAALGNAARPHYRPALENLVRFVQSQQGAGMPAERVAQAILHALSAPHPKARYVLGSAHGLNVLALLPLRLRDRIVRTMQRL
ncbi:MAG TPA: SDR family NAD(P)-dependent oxidoreductase [Candidatus Cybelea sp.]